MFHMSLFIRRKPCVFFYCKIHKCSGYFCFYAVLVCSSVSALISPCILVLDSFNISPKERFFFKDGQIKLDLNSFRDLERSDAVFKLVETGLSFASI